MGKLIGRRTRRTDLRLVRFTWFQRVAMVWSILVHGRLVVYVQGAKPGTDVAIGSRLPRDAKEHQGVADAARTAAREKLVGTPGRDMQAEAKTPGGIPRLGGGPRPVPAPRPAGPAVPMPSVSRVAYRPRTEGATKIKGQE